MERETFQSRLGFLLLSAGCAIGIGNVWKFPWMCGQNGGGSFMLVYFICLIVLGIPAMVMEFSVGRAAQTSPVRMYRRLEKPGQKWHIHGWFCLIGCYLLMMYYTTVSGWMVSYFGRFLTGKFYSGMPAEDASAVFGELLANPVEMGILAVAIVIVGFVVCSFGLQKGLERVSKVMMIALLAIMVVLAVNSIRTPGSGEGLRFYLIPDFGRMAETGVANVVVGAMNQAFFTLSLGMGGMAIFGSYIGKDRSLLGESVNVALLDTFVAFSSGLIIFPACFAYGVDVDSGPSLIFLTLPNIFNHIPLGRLWGSLFFVFMSFAALSTVLAVFEEITACVEDLTGWSRRKCCIFNGILLLVLSIPCCLGFNVLSGFQPLGEGTNIMDIEDFIVSNLVLPLGSLVLTLFCTMKKGWGWDNYISEVNTGKGMKMKNIMRGYMTYILPVMIAVIFVIGIIQKFFPA